MWQGKTILITGGTGSFGHAFTSFLLLRGLPRKIIIYSRDEFKQSEMRKTYQDERLRFFIGNVRDADRLRRACYGVDYVVHAAALKQVPSCEYNPWETVKTNIMGAQNVIEACLENRVGKAVILSSDKATAAYNLYGKTKAVAESLFVHGNVYSGSNGPLFSVCRYGNIAGSRGSVIPHFLKLHKNHRPLTVTSEEMTRFWMTLEEAVQLVAHVFEMMVGTEIFVPRLPVFQLMHLAEAISNKLPQIVGIRPGEKLHEVLVAPSEVRHTVDSGTHFVILSEAFPERSERWQQISRTTFLSEQTGYSSNSLCHLTVGELRERLEDLYGSDAFLG